jgi:phosphoribosyl 1,2-cyclic phosphodiesterase
MSRLTSTFAILGSGASTAIPFLACALSPRAGAPRAGVAGLPDSCCAVCADALDNPRAPNKRGNVSALARVARPDGCGTCEVVVDCGKTFRDTVARVWPTLSPPLRRIDALLISHAHADACMGLDCLREVSPGAPVHVYAAAPALAKMAAAFPYLFPPPGAPPSQSFVGSLVAHVVVPWVPFELVGSGGVLVTPIPVEHAGPFSVDCAHGELTLAFEFGAVLAGGGAVADGAGGADGDGSGCGGGSGSGNSGSASGDGSRGGGHGAAASSGCDAPDGAGADTGAGAGAALPVLGADARGLPTLPPWRGDRVLWVSDVRALSAEARAYLRARATRLLCVDALGFRSYPTHFCIGQALAAAADVVGPGSASAAARAAAAGAPGADVASDDVASADVLLVGLNHEVDHASESAALSTWSRGARVLAAPVGGEPVSWAPGAADDGLAAAPTVPLALRVDLARDGLAVPGLALDAPYASAATLGAEVAAVRAAARALAASDGIDHGAVAAARLAVPRSHTADPPGWDVNAVDAAAVGAPMRRREDYLNARPAAFRSYDRSASARVRGEWVSRVSPRA